jgi:hypothetical protein
MGASRFYEFYEFQVRLTKDKDTGQVVAEVPALDIADYGMDSQQALQRLKWMKGNPYPQKRGPEKVST